MSKRTTIKKPAAKANKKTTPEQQLIPTQVEREVSLEVEASGGEPVVNHTPEVTAVPVKTSREKVNGVTRPRPGKCGDVWGVCDELVAAGKTISFEAIRAELPTSIADATIKTQRQRHRTFHGLGSKAV